METIFQGIPSLWSTKTSGILSGTVCILHRELRSLTEDISVQVFCKTTYFMPVRAVVSASLGVELVHFLLNVSNIRQN